MKNIFSKTLMIFTALIILNGCGVKPANVESPGQGQDEYPHTYPDPATDPAAPPNNTVQF